MNVRWNPLVGPVVFLRFSGSVFFFYTALQFLRPSRWICSQRTML
jgi:hypothetical protein